MVIYSRTSFPRYHYFAILPEGRGEFQFGNKTLFGIRSSSDSAAPYLGGENKCQVSTTSATICLPYVSKATGKKTLSIGVLTGKSPNSTVLCFPSTGGIRTEWASVLPTRGCGVSILGVVWMWAWAACSRGLCLSRGVGRGDLQRALPTSAIL